jgi:glycosyltransferase involved in cell wall biosynthesis
MTGQAESRAGPASGALHQNLSEGGGRTALRVTIIVPVKNDPPVFRAVERILASGIDPSVEILVVDNGSAPAFRASLDRLPAPVRVLDEFTPGQAAARNHGVRVATGDVIFFTDADAMVPPGWVAAGLAAFAETRADAVIGPSVDIALTPAAEVLTRLGAKNYRRLSAQSPTRVNTANLAANREVMAEYPFDETLLRHEDTAWGFRVQAHGVTIAFAPAMHVDHECDIHFDVSISKAVPTGWAHRAARRRYPEIAEARTGPAAGRKVAILRYLHRRACRFRPALQFEVVLLLSGARLLERAVPLLPSAVSETAVGMLITLGASLGNAMHATGYPSPTVDGVRRGKLPKRGRRVSRVPPAL